MSSLTINAQNIKCGGCASAIQAGLADMAGIDKVDVDVTSGDVTIEGNDLNLDTIPQKLAELGYPASE